MGTSRQVRLGAAAVAFFGSVLVLATAQQPPAAEPARQPRVPAAAVAPHTLPRLPSTAVTTGTDQGADAAALGLDPQELVDGDAAVTGPSVLVVRADRGADLPALAAAARVEAARAGGRVRLVNRTLGVVSVEVPPSEAALVRRALSGTVHARSVDRPAVMLPARSPHDTYFGPDQRMYLRQIHVPRAWDVTTGSRRVRIGIVDSGVDRRHPDLAGKVVARHDAASGGRDVTDVDEHGTMVAGVAAAATDNHRGVAGVGWRSSLVVAKVADRSGLIYTDAVADGVVWATRHGARVVNLSLGSTADDPVLRRAVAYAVRRDVVVVAAAGNDGAGRNKVLYPAAYPGVLAVGATDGPARASFSEHGSWVDVAAPGVAIAGPVPGSRRAGYGYAVGDGTSFSSPLVAGEAALIRAVRPHLSAARVRAAITRSASGFHGQGLGTGRVDVRAALDHVTRPSAPSAVSSQAGVGRATVRWRSPAGHGAAALAGYEVAYRPVGTSHWSTARVGARAHRLTRRLRDRVRYQMRVAARNRFGRGPWSRSTSVLVGLPTAPRDVVVAPDGATVTVSWKAPSSLGGTSVTHYDVQVRPVGTTSWVLASRVSAGARVVTVTDLSGGTRYDVRVVAAHGTRYGDPSRVTRVRLVAPPSTPDAPVAEVTSDQVEVGWPAPASDGGSAVTGYRVSVLPLGSHAWLPAGFTTAPGWTRDGVAPGTYEYRVAAVNAVGPSGWSTPSGFVTVEADLDPGLLDGVGGPPVVPVTPAL